MNPEDLSQLQALLAPAQNILVLTGENAGQDSLAASLSLFLSLDKLGKSVSVVCPETATVEFANLIGIDKLKSGAGNKNLIISFPYKEGAIEKVSYNIEDGKFNLVIQPQAGGQPLDPERVSFSYSGIKGDLFFVVGTPDLKDLGSLYAQERNLYTEVLLVNIDHHAENTRYGRINLVNSQSSSVSEIIALILQNLGLPLDSDIATNLLTGITSATNNFSSPKTSPSAFEAAAWCLKAGGRRQAGLPRKEEKIEIRPMPQEVSAKKPPPAPEAPPDWLAPKIYKGSMEV